MHSFSLQHMKLWVQNNNSLMSDIQCRFNPKQFSPFTGCPLKVQNYEQVETLPLSAFKLYLQAQNCLNQDQKSVEEYTEELFPSQDDDALAMVFYLNYKAMSRAQGQIDIQQSKKVAQQVLKLTQNITLRFVASLYLQNDQIEEVITIQEEMLKYARSSPELSEKFVLDSNLISFPSEIITIILAHNRIRNGQTELALPLLQSVTGYDVEYAELLFSMGKEGFEDARKVIFKQLATLTNVNEQDIIDKLKNYKFFEVLNQDLQEIRWKVPHDLKFLKPYSQLITILGEIDNNPQYFGFAIALNVKNARPYRDLGVYYISEYKQQNTSVRDQKIAITNACYLLYSAYQLEPSDRACRENLISLQILTKSNLSQAKKICLDLIGEFGEHKQYNQNIAMIDDVDQNYESSLYYYLKAVKQNTEQDVSLLLQATAVLLELKEKANIMNTESALYLLEETMITLRRNLMRNTYQGEQKVTFVQNFIWNASPNALKVFNILADMRERRGLIENVKRVFGQWLDIVKEYSSTQAGDETLGAYVGVYKRLE